MAYPPITAELPVELVRRILITAAEADTYTAINIGRTCRAAHQWISDVWTRDIWMDISIDGTAVGTLQIHLYDDVARMASRNFRELVKGHLVAKDGTPLTYKGCTFNRMLRTFLVQCGDLDGKGGQSIYGKPFPDEIRNRRFDRRGVIGMANSGTGSNTSQFFITLGRASWLQNHTIFGEVMAPDGDWSVLEKIAQVDGIPMRLADAKNASPPDVIMRSFLIPETPKRTIRIDDCGIILRSL